MVRLRAGQYELRGVRLQPDIVCGVGFRIGAYVVTSTHTVFSR